MEIRPRETVILADDVETLVAWYRDVLGFKDVQLFEDGYHYAYMETASGIKIGIGSAEEMGVVPVDRSKNTAILQVEVVPLRSDPHSTTRASSGSAVSQTQREIPAGSWTRTVHRSARDRR